MRRINLYELLADPSEPDHWPISSIYRLKSIRARALKTCKNVEIEISELLPVIKKITKESLLNNSGQDIKPHTLKTYRSVLLRYIVEKIEKKKLRPWEAMRYINLIK